MSAGIEQRNQDATIYVGNIDEKCNDELIWELFIQVGKYLSCGPTALREAYVA